MFLFKDLGNANSRVWIVIEDSMIWIFQWCRDVLFYVCMIVEIWRIGNLHGVRKNVRAAVNSIIFHHIYDTKYTYIYS